MEHVVAILIFVVVGIVLFIFFRKKFVTETKDLILYSDERTLYTEYPVKCWLKNRNTNKVYMPKSKIELTNYRIFLYQKYLFGQKFMLNYVVNYRLNRGEEFNRMDNVKFKNFMDVLPNGIRFESKKGIDYILIEVPENNILSTFAKASIVVSTNDISKVKQIIGID